jgi:hypothetical protein
MKILQIISLALISFSVANHVYAAKGVGSTTTPGKGCTTGNYICWPESGKMEGGVMVIVPKHCEASSSGAYTCKEDCEKACR